MFRFALFLIIAIVPLSASAQFDIEREPVNYLKSPLSDPISRLQKRLNAEEVRLTFDGLPTELKEIVYRKLHDVLTGIDQSSTYQHLSNEDRQAILAILLGTKRDLPPSWRE